MLTAHQIRTAVTAAGIVFLAGSALGQNALGGGRALDGGLSSTPGGRVNASVGDLQTIIRVNTNAGNALNGPGFVGSSINRGTAYTGTLAGSGLLNRGTSSYGSSLGSSSREQFDRIAVLEAGYLPNGSLTSTVTLPQGAGATDYRRGGDPYVGFVRDNQGGIILTRGSALRGISIDTAGRLNTPSATDVPKVGTAATYERVIDDLRRASIARALDQPNRINTAVTPTPVNTAPGTPPKPSDTTKAPGDKPSPVANPGSATDKPTNQPAGAPLQYDPEATLKRLRERLAPKPQPAPANTDRARQPDVVTTPNPSNTATVALTEEDINALRGMGLRLDALVPPGATDAQATDGYTRLGQESLAAGRFGLADEMFQAALSRSPGNAMAHAGRIHATMGLGLLMSAGTDLRGYFVEHPEMIPVRFAGTLLVPRARADTLADMLTADLARADGPMLDNAGLTLAYLGRQFDNPAWLAKGLSAMADQTKNDPQGTELLTILKKVWGEPSAPAK